MSRDVDVRTEVVIRRPVEVVAGYAGDPGNAPEWYANIRTVSWRTPPPLAVGWQLDFVAHFLGRRLAYTYEVVELEPGRRLVMRTSDGPFPMETAYTLGGRRRRRDAEDAAQPRATQRVRLGRRPCHGRRDAPGQHRRPGQAGRTCSKGRGAPTG